MKSNFSAVAGGGSVIPLNLEFMKNNALGTLIQILG